MNKQTYTYQLQDTMRFGKFRGHTLQSLIDKKPWYIKWCITTLPNFKMSEQAWEYACEQGTEFVSMKPKPDSTASAKTTNASRLTSEGIEILDFYPFRDIKKARERFIAYMKREAVDVTWEAIPACQPVQLSLWQ